VSLDPYAIVCARHDDVPDARLVMPHVKSKVCAECASPIWLGLAGQKMAKQAKRERRGFSYVCMWCYGLDNMEAEARSGRAFLAPGAREEARAAMARRTRN
jgi:hypothetical protein